MADKRLGTVEAAYQTRLINEEAPELAELQNDFQNAIQRAYAVLGEKEP